MTWESSKGHMLRQLITPLTEDSSHGGVPSSPDFLRNPRLYSQARLDFFSTLVLKLILKFF